MPHNDPEVEAARISARATITAAIITALPAFAAIIGGLVAVLRR